ncbi:MAG: hypothetical protein K8R92_06750 [Planctomycetes bacterium]|nr:hypothetical protein [Planctomycetota bacterium]
MSNSFGLGKVSAVATSLPLAVALMGLTGMASTSNADIAASWSGDFGVGLTVGASSNTAWGQTFLSHATGLLQNVSIGYIGSSGFQDITLTIWTTDGGNPDVAMAARSLHPSQLGGYPNPSIFDFSDDPIWILDGQNYMWSLSVASADDGMQGIAASYLGGYTEGSLKVSFNGAAGPWNSGYQYSVPFEVNTVIPAPGTAALLGLSGLLTSRRRR